MDAQVLSSTANEVGLSFTDTDIATLYIIQHELQKMPDVEFVGVILKHPLTSESWMRVISKSDPKQNIMDAVSTALDSVSEIKDVLNTDIRV